MSDIKLTDDQEKAYNAFLDFLVDKEAKYMVIQGGAGSGKTTLLGHLLETFEDKYKTYNILLQRNPEHTFTVDVTATTNKAAAVLSEFMYKDARTIHSLLGLKVFNDFKTGKTKLSKTHNTVTLVNHLIIIDEASFIDNQLFKCIDEYTKSCKILLVGDQYQLAPVGQTESVMETLDCTKVHMNKIMRNSGDILKTSAQFKNTVQTGKFEPISYNSDSLIHVDGPTFEQIVSEEYSDTNWNPTKAKILAWTNAKVQAYNNHIRKNVLKLPEQFQDNEVVMTNNPIVRLGKPVDSLVRITSCDYDTNIKGIHGRMITLNNCYQAFLANDFQDVNKLLKKLAKKKEWKDYFEIKDSWLDLRSVYASSIHKSQGSTYEKVFIDLADIGNNWTASDVARLLYVAISRASKQVICYGYLPDKYDKGSFKL